MINPIINDGRFKNHRWIETESIDDFRPRLASDVIKLRHTGWFCDDMQGEKTFGIVLRLPNKRGFMAGCSDPYNWPKRGFGSCLVENYVYVDEDTAARCADQIAEYYAEECRDDDERFRDEQEKEDAENERMEQLNNLP